MVSQNSERFSTFLKKQYAVGKGIPDYLRLIIACKGLRMDQMLKNDFQYNDSVGRHYSSYVINSTATAKGVSRFHNISTSLPNAEYFKSKCFCFAVLHAN